MSRGSSPSKSLADSIRRASSKTRREKIPLPQVLQRAGLEEYNQFLEKAGFKYLDANAHPSDQEVDQMLDDTERFCGVAFLPDVRARLWKAIRYQWYRGQKAPTPILHAEVPHLTLPKPDYRHADAMVKLTEVDPDRRRQIIRKTRHTEEPVARGPATMTVQFEVFNRQRDLWYEFKDIERCVEEWQRRNPRTMMKEDPREEIMKLRLRKVEEAAAFELTARRVVAAQQKRISVVLSCMRAAMIGMSAVMFGTVYYQFKDLPKQLTVSFALGSKQFVSGVAFFIAYIFMYTIGLRRHASPMAVKLQRLLYSVQRIMEMISDFRVETEAQRMVSQDMDAGGISALFKSRAKNQRKRELGAQRRKKSKKKDEALNLWCMPEDLVLKKDPALLMQVIRREVEDSYKRLPDLPDSFHRPGGNRMLAFSSKMGLTEEMEEKLCFRLPTVPKAPPMLGLAGPARLQELPPPSPPELPGPPPPHAPSLASRASSSSASAGKVLGEARRQGSLEQARAAVGAPPPRAPRAEPATPDAGGRAAPWPPGHMPREEDASSSDA